MDNRSLKRLTIFITAFMLIITIACTGGGGITVYADSSKILTLGADLSLEQKQLIIDYLGVNESEVETILVYNSDEHALLDNIATQGQIGKKTYSCSYIEPTSSGGIHVKTVNLNWVTCDMIRNALVTSGIGNCNIICIAPIEVSGTGALTGIFKAYESISGVEITEEKKELASEELIATCNLAGTIGQDDASTMMNELKEQIILSSEAVGVEEIKNLVNEAIQIKEISLTEDQKWEIIDFLLKLSKQDYDIDKIREAYTDVKTAAANVRNASKQAMNWLERFWNWLKELWQKITGTYNQIKQSQQYAAVKQQLGILAETNDSLFGDNAVITITEDAVLEDNEGEASGETENVGTETSGETGNVGTENAEADKENESTENIVGMSTGEETKANTENEGNTGSIETGIDGHWYSGLLKIFNTGNGKQNIEPSIEQKPESESTEQEILDNETIEHTEPAESQLPQLNTSKSLSELIK